MISVQEATGIIQSNLFTPRTRKLKLENALHRVLAEDVVADRDFPPFNRVMMDGIAISSASFSLKKQYEIENIQYAGSRQLSLSNVDNCIEVMTGATLPQNTDAVIRYEDLTIENSLAVINLDEVKAFQNIQKQGVEACKSDLLLNKNTQITPAVMGVLATVGKSEVEVYSELKVAIISTGDELVPISEKPAAHQIRQSNSHTLKSLLQKQGVAGDIYHLTDDKEKLKRKISNILKEYDLILLTGGVSRGKKDYVPEVLSELGVKEHLHRVKQKPAKPLWFGSSDNTFVFGLPGNPVSTFLGYHRYVLPWINQSYNTKLNVFQAILKCDFEFKPDLTYFLQVKLTTKDGYMIADPVVGKGSGDLLNLIEADGFLELPAGQSHFKQGDRYKFIPFS